MLRRNAKSAGAVEGARYYIVASRYNARFVDSMLRAAKDELAKSGAAAVEVLRVPGAFEIPVAAARAARRGRGERAAVICLGVILRGATTHAQHIGDAVTQALVQIQVETEVPVIHEVLLLENAGQARERCLDPERNRGREAAQTAIAMVRALENWPGGGATGRLA
jgi:6,7-dimethyl-8-ribityllumazine synthase